MTEAETPSIPEQIARAIEARAKEIGASIDEDADDYENVMRVRSPQFKGLHEAARIAREFKPTSSWISVEERLPEHGVYVLAYGTGGTTTARHYMNLWWYQRNGEPIDKPTHWQPDLPPPSPKGDAQAVPERTP